MVLKRMEWYPYQAICHPNTNYALAFAMHNAVATKGVFIYGTIFKTDKDTVFANAC